MAAAIRSRSDVVGARTIAVDAPDNEGAADDRPPEMMRLCSPVPSGARRCQFVGELRETVGVAPIAEARREVNLLTVRCGKIGDETIITRSDGRRDPRLPNARDAETVDLCAGGDRDLRRAFTCPNPHSTRYRSIGKARL